MLEYEINGLYINPTRFCNLRCSHCWINPPFVSGHKISETELAIEEWINIIRAAQPLGLNAVKLTGGEPLLRNDYESLFDFCRQNNIAVIIESNGTMIDKKMAQMLKRFEISLVAVSLDGVSARINDSFRGVNGAFDLTVSGISNLVECGVALQVITCLHRENANNFDAFLSFINSLGVGEIKVNVINHIGRADQMMHQKQSLSVKEVLDFSSKMSHYKNIFKRKLSLDIPAAFKKLEELDDECTCGVFGILGVLSNGDVSICGIGSHMDDLIFGSLKNKTLTQMQEILAQIWGSNHKLKELRRDVPLRLEGVCGKCLMKTRCLGKCRAESYYHYGHFRAPDIFCQTAFEQGLFPFTRLMPESSIQDNK
jgi:SynChlorMet cassette radical SAM/SPASM protein ScmF